MNTPLGSIPPRLLKFRHQYVVYFRVLGFVALSLLCFWPGLIFSYGWESVSSRYPLEMVFSGMYLVAFSIGYACWWRLKLRQTIQVFSDHLLVHRKGKKTEVRFEHIEAVQSVCWSLFYVKMKSGDKHYFNSTLERVDYIWEGVYSHRPELFKKDEYESFRVKLVQYDHHQKRKEWFFRHRFLDVLNWCFLPMIFMSTIYWYQSQEVQIYQPIYYFFRLTMYSALTLLSTAFVYMIIVKKLVFDKKVEEQLEAEPSDKIRDLDYENVIIQRTKFFQTVSVVALFTMIIQSDFNMYTLTKLRGNVANFQLIEGKTMLVDNRYNCSSCKYSIQEGDVVVYSKGQIGQVIARGGDVIGQVTESKTGRSIASINTETVMMVPKGKVALKLAGDDEMIIIEESDLVGKLQN